MHLFYDYLPTSEVHTTTSSGPRTLRDTTQVDFTKPLQVAFVGPSITPLTGLNAGYRVYQIDSHTFSVMGAQTYFANMSNSLTWTTPVWEAEYDTRETYAVASEEQAAAEDTDSDSASTPGIPWPSKAPLNATFWHLVTEKMLSESSSSSSPTPPSKSLLDLYNLYESKSSLSRYRRVSGGDDASPEQKVCFLRAGSGYLGRKCREMDGGKDARGLREREFGIR